MSYPHSDDAAWAPPNLPGWEEAPDDFPVCCDGVAIDGPKGCTCWEPVFNLEQQPVVLPVVEPTTRTKCCTRCAYRVGSPERERGEWDDLMDIAGGRETFWCHEGMRRVIAWRHPVHGLRPAEPGDYRPHIGMRLAFRADGTPAARCAGWDAHRRRCEKPEPMPEAAV
jgi:hypothetical protein